MPGASAVCTAAKDCSGDVGGTIQGTKGFIRTTAAPNSVGDAVLQLNDGTTETFREAFAGHRALPEFTQFIRAVREKDHDFCYAQLEKSLAVNEVLNRARIQAGIRFK